MCRRSYGSQNPVLARFPVGSIHDSLIAMVAALPNTYTCIHTHAKCSAGDFPVREQKDFSQRTETTESRKCDTLSYATYMPL